MIFSEQGSCPDCGDTEMTESHCDAESLCWHDCEQDGWVRVCNKCGRVIDSQECTEQPED